MVQNREGLCGRVCEQASTFKRLAVKQSLADPSLYTRFTEDAKLLVCCIVDEFVITGTPNAIKRFKSEVSREWEMTDEGILFWCLNLRVTRDMDRGLLKIDQDQSQHVDELRRRFNMQDCNPRQTPMDEKPVFYSDMCPVLEKGEDYKETFPYASTIGSLLYVRLTTADALVAINKLARFMKNPCKQH